MGTAEISVYLSRSVWSPRFFSQSPDSRLSVERLEKGQVDLVWPEGLLTIHNLPFLPCLGVDYKAPPNMPSDCHSFFLCPSDTNLTLPGVHSPFSRPCRVGDEAETSKPGQPSQCTAVLKCLCSRPVQGRQHRCLSECLHTCEAALVCTSHLAWEVLADICVQDKYTNAFVHMWKSTHMFKLMTVTRACDKCLWQEAKGHQPAGLFWEGLRQEAWEPIQSNTEYFLFWGFRYWASPWSRRQLDLEGRADSSSLRGATGCFGVVLGEVAVKWGRAADEKTPVVCPIAMWRCPSQVKVQPRTQLLGHPSWWRAAQICLASLPSMQGNDLLLTCITDSSQAPVRPGVIVPTL